jgi:hypothetical protein
MSALAPQAPGIEGPGNYDGQRPPRRRNRRRAAAVGAVVVVAATGVVAVVLVSPFSHGSNSGGVLDNGYPTLLAPVTMQTLTSQSSVTGTLGYAGSYSVTNQQQGVYTWLPSVGQLVAQGQVLYRVDQSPVVLLYGRVPVYRALSEGMIGADVRQLNRALVALGYATPSVLDPKSDYFSAETAYALELLQEHLGVTQTGFLALGQAVFLPSVARITSVPVTVGAAASPGPVLTATSTARQVTVGLDAGDRSTVAAGDDVTIVLPGGKTTPGRVSSVGKVATTAAGQSTPSVTVKITPLHPAATGTLDQAPVSVSITTGMVKNALVVPVNALLAQPSGGYSVEEVTATGTHHLVPVSLGMFDDAAGLVQVTGAGLAAGQQVVVPGP